MRSRRGESLRNSARRSAHHETTDHAPVTSTGGAFVGLNVGSIHAKSRVVCDEPVTTKMCSRGG